MTERGRHELTTVVDETEEFATEIAQPVPTVRKLFAGYKRPDGPLASYATLVGIFNAAFAGFLLLTNRSNKAIPERVGLADIALLGLATHKLSRLLAKDWVTSFLRAPFTEYQGSAGPGEVNEKPRGTGMQLALGELLTCPFCMGQWVAAFFGYGLVLAPRVTRLVGSIFVMLTISDFLHLAYGASRTSVQQQEQISAQGSQEGDQ